MLSDKPWKPEAVFLLMAGMLMSLGAGSLVFAGLNAWAPASTEAGRAFYQFLASSLCFQGGGLVWLTWFLRQHDLGWRQWLGVDRPGWLRAAGWAVATAGVALPLTWGLSEVSAWLIERLIMPPEPQRLIRMFGQFGPVKQALMGAVAVGVAPVVEEALFRGVLYTLIKHRGFPTLAVVVSSLAFAAVHMNLLTFLPLTALALGLVWLYEKTGRLLAPIVTHALFNAGNLVMMFAQLHGGAGG